MGGAVERAMFGNHCARRVLDGWSRGWVFAMSPLGDGRARGCDSALADRGTLVTKHMSDRSCTTCTNTAHAQLGLKCCAHAVWYTQDSTTRDPMLVRCSCGSEQLHLPSQPPERQCA